MKTVWGVRCGVWGAGCAVWAFAGVMGFAPLATAQNPTPHTPHPTPSLVVVITVDQMRGDYLDRWARQFTGAFAKVRREGAVFLNAAQDHAIPETAAGHAAILSGRHPASTGILRNDDGVQDPAYAVIGFPDSGDGVSGARFQGTALYDWMLARWPDARALSVARKDRSAVFPLGNNRQATALWYRAGYFTSSRYFGDSLPAWVRAFNREGLAAARVPSREWTLLLPESQYPEGDSMPYENRGRSFTFPHRMPADSDAAARRLIDFPWMDSLTLALALRGVETMQLGARGAPDLLHVGLSTTDAIGHGFGPDSRELHDMVLRVDRWLGSFLDSLGRLRDLRSVSFVMTADHGVSPYPEARAWRGEPEYGYVNVDTVLTRYRTALRAAARDPQFAPFGFREYGLVTLNRRGLAAKGLDADSVVTALRADIARIPGVWRVDTRATIAGADTARDWVARRWHHMLGPNVDVGVLITLRPAMVFGTTGTARHGHVSMDGSSVTLAFWGHGFRRGRHNGRVSTVDIAPTLASVLGIDPDPAVQGRVLTEALQRR